MNCEGKNYLIANVCRIKFIFLKTSWIGVPKSRKLTTWRRRRQQRQRTALAVEDSPPSFRHPLHHHLTPRRDANTIACHHRRGRWRPMTRKPDALRWWVLDARNTRPVNFSGRSGGNCRPRASVRFECRANPEYYCAGPGSRGVPFSTSPTE